MAGVIKLILFLSLASSGAYAVTAQTLYDVFLRTAPRSPSAVNWFAVGATDARFREDLSALIASDPKLKAAAEKGMKVREAFKAWLDKISPRDPTFRKLFLEPKTALWDSYEAFRLSQRLTTETRLTPDEIHLRALEETVHMFSYLTPDEVARQIALKEDGPEIHYRNRVKYWSNQTITKTGPAPKLDEKGLREWKSEVVLTLKDAQSKTLSAMLREAIALDGIHYSSDLGWSWLWGTNRKNFIPPSEAENVSLEIGGPKEAKWLQGLAQSRLSWVLPRTFYQVISFLSTIPAFIFDGFVNPVKRHIGTRAIGNQSDDRIVNLEWRPSLAYRRLHPESLEIIQRTVPLTSVLTASAFSPRQKTAGESLEWVGTDPIHSFLRTGRLRDEIWEKLATEMDPVRHETVDRFQRRLHQVQTDLPPLPDLADRRDLLAGLEWFGYGIDPDYWKLRDEVAIAQLNIPAKGEPVEKPFWRTLRAVNDRISRLPRAIRSVIAAGAISAFVSGIVAPVHYFTSWAVGPEKASSDAPTESLVPAGIGKAFNKNGQRFSSKPAFEIEATKRPLSQLPVYLDRISRDETGLRYSESETIQPTQAVPDFRIKNRLPVFPGELGEAILPSVIGHEVTSVELEGTEAAFTIRRDALSRRFYLQLTDAESWPKDKPLSLKVGYKASDQYQENRNFAPFQNLDADKLERIAGELHSLGFWALSNGLNQMLDEMRRGERKNLDDLRKVFNQSGTYEESEFTKSSDEEFTPTGPVNFEVHARFLKGGKLCAQCDGGNEFFHNFLLHYFADDPDISVIQQRTFLRDGDATAVTLRDAHRVTVIGTRDGRFQWTLDATPDALRLGSAWSVIPDPPLVSLPPPPKVRLVGPPPPKTDPRLKPATMAQHLARQTQLEQLIRAARKSPFYSTLSPLNQRATQADSIFSLGRALLGYAAHGLTFRELKDSVATLYPQVSLLADPRDLGKVLSEIQKHYEQLSASMQTAAAKHPRAERKKLALPGVWSGFHALLSFYAGTHWMPVHKPNPRNQSTEKILRPATVEEHDARVATVERLQREIPSDEKAKNRRWTMGIEPDLQRTTLLGAALKRYAEGATSFRKLLSEMAAQFPEVVVPDEVKDPRALGGLLERIHELQKARAGRSADLGGTWTGILRLTQYYQGTHWMPVYRFRQNVDYFKPIPPTCARVLQALTHSKP